MIVEITYDAKCKDCRFLKVWYKGKLKRHMCNNRHSSNDYQTRTLKDKACDKFEL